MLFLFLSSFEIKGALGQALVQICKHLGAFVIGTVSTEEKAKISKQLGCDEVINYSEKNFEEEVKRITNGKGKNKFENYRFLIFKFHPKKKTRM